MIKPLLRTLFSRTGFRQQLVLTFTIGVICLALLSSIAISTLSSRAVRTKLIEEGQQVIANFAAQSTLALLYHSADNAKDAIKATLAFPDVQGVAIYDLNYRALLIEGEEALPPGGGQWFKEPRLELETAQAWYFVAPVYAHLGAADQVESPFMLNPPKPELIGFVRMVMSKKTLHTMVDNLLRGNLVVSAGFATVLLVLLLAITKRLTTPLKNLADTMKRAELGETQIRAEVRGPRDIIEMESAFNTMMTVLDAREQELKIARDAALELARIKGEFAANVSHELRTPLNGVLGMLELLQSMGLTAKQHEYLEVAHHSGDALLALIDNILDFSRIGSGKLKPELVDFYLQEILDDVVGLLAGQAQRKDLDLGYVITQDIPTALQGDPGRIRQVLINFVGNAIKFTERGEIAIEIESEKEDEGRVWVRFQVRDTGIGIPVKAQQHIFEAFSQADGSTTRKYGGTGLGLAISRQLVELMGGEIGVESKPGKGSLFWFLLPLERSAQVPARPESNRTDVAGLRILIADDSTVNRAFLEQTFKTWGIYHSSATDGHQALEMLRTAAIQGRSYDLIIVDLCISGMKGNELVSQITNDPLIAPVKVVIMTNQWRLSHNEMGHIGTATYLAKPVREPLLYNCIVTMMKQGGVNPLKSLSVLPNDIAAAVGSRILVVEDNRANQQVAVGMLERLGYTIDVAGNGQQALEAVMRQSYDLVLMDCHMPQMDGYETTARIRALEAGKAHIPIIAMTANVQQGDSERCLAAGMDDYLPKPLKLDLIRAKLQHWLAPQGCESLREMDHPCIDLATLTSDDALDGNVFSELRESMGGAFSRLIEVFLEDIPLYLRSLEKAIAEGDGQALADLAHSVKGSARNLGANRLAAVCKQLEDLGRSESIDGGAHLLTTLATEYELVKAVLQHEIMPDKGEQVARKENQWRILVVDDDRGMRFALRSALEADGYRIDEASNGAQALSLCERRMPDLILMDAVMPVTDGFTACMRILNLPGSGHVPVLIITALDDERYIERAFAAGATDYIPKPVHFAVLRQRVGRLLHASRAEKRVHELAYHDALTGLPNRTLFMERLGELLTHPRREGHMLAILFLDLDRFKLINDTLGHDVGDLLLKAVAERIQRCVRSRDIVARLGGDEFTIILDGVKSTKVIASVAEKICSALADPFVFMEQEMYVTTSIGISIYPVDGKDIGTLMKYADTAMYRAKEYRGNYQFYEHGMEAAVTKRLELERELRRALERDEFVLYYQPQADLMTGKIESIEALLRWQHPERGLIPPSEFIPLAEETGLIIDIGDWVLRTACMQVQSWRQRGFDPLRVAINLSGRQLEKQDLVKKVADALTESGLPPGQLELEITESVIMKRAEEVISLLRQLKELGIKLAIDDFGIGYSSLNYLKRFPVDMLKIDRSFLQDIDTDPYDVAIITGIIALAQSLRLKVIAEGVETRDQHAFLKEQKCDLMQGYYLSKPLPAMLFEERILRQEKFLYPIGPDSSSTDMMNKKMMTGAQIVEECSN